MTGPAVGRVRAALSWAEGRWPGRIVLGTLQSIVRLEIFDRSMTLAAQMFTSIFPLLLMTAVLVGRGADRAVAEVVDVAPAAREVLSDAVDGGGSSTFGVIGALVVLISTTSLARAFTRTYATLWYLPRPRSDPRDAWRWLLAVLVLAAVVVVMQILVRAAPALTPVVDFGAALFVPWILTARRVPARQLAPGALLFAIVMMVLRPAGSIYLPHALEVSADRFGSIGLAFTYIGWLYVVAFAYLVTVAAGQVIATDPGRLGRLIRGPEAPASPAVDGGPAAAPA